MVDAQKNAVTMTSSDWYIVLRAGNAHRALPFRIIPKTRNSEADRQILDMIDDKILRTLGSIGESDHMVSVSLELGEIVLLVTVLTEFLANVFDVDIRLFLSNKRGSVSRSHVVEILENLNRFFSDREKVNTQ